MTPLELVRSVLAGRDERVAVTGATGWFGRTALELLSAVFGDRLGDRVVGYASTARSMTLSCGRVVPLRPLTELASADLAVTCLLHFAFLTREKAAVLGVGEYAVRNAQISATVLDAVTRLRPRRLVVVSSGAVHGADGRFVTDVAADPYGALKRIDELAFRGAAEQVGAVVVTARVFSVAGPWMTHPGAYALGSMIEMAAAGGPVTVRAQRPVHRAYRAVDEVVALSLWAAFEAPSTLFETGGRTVEMGELAAVVAAASGGCRVVRPSFDPAAEADTYVGDGTVMDGLAQRAWLRLRTLEQLVSDTCEAAR